MKFAATAWIVCATWTLLATSAVSAVAQPLRCRYKIARSPEPWQIAARNVQFAEGLEERFLSALSGILKVSGAANIVKAIKKGAKHARDNIPKDDMTKQQQQQQQQPKKEKPKQRKQPKPKQ